MLLGSSVIFLAVLVNTLQSFNLRRISDPQSQNNSFYSIRYPITVVTEVPSHFSPIKGLVSSIEIQNHSKQSHHSMDSRNNVTEDFARIESKTKPVKNKRKIGKKVSNTETRLHYTELKRLKRIHPDKINKLLDKRVINDSGKNHKSRAVKNLLKNNFAETEDAFSSAKNAESKKNVYKGNISKWKTNFNKKDEFSISDESKIGTLTKSLSKPSITHTAHSKPIENNNKDYIEELLAKKNSYKNKSERDKIVIIKTYHLPESNNSHYSRLSVEDHKVYNPILIPILKKRPNNIYKNGKYYDDSKLYVDIKHNNIEKNADETLHGKNYLKRYFQCQKGNDKCVHKSKVKNKIIHSLHHAEYVTSMNMIRANKHHPLRIKEGQKIKKLQPSAAMLHQPTTLKRKNYSEKLNVNNGIKTFAHTDKNTLRPNKNIRQKSVFRKNTGNIKKPGTNPILRKYAVNKENNNGGTVGIIQENTKSNTSILEVYNIANLKGRQFHSIYNVTGQTYHSNTGNEANKDFTAGKTTDLHMNNSNNHKNSDHKKNEELHSVSEKSILRNKTNKNFKVEKETDFYINESNHHKNRIFKVKLLKMEYIKLNSTQKNNNHISSTERSSNYVDMKRMLPEDMTTISLVNHTSAPSKLLLKRLEEFISIKNVTRTALTNYTSDLNSKNLHKYSLISHKDANHTSNTPFSDHFTQSANITKSSYNKSKEKAIINFVTTPFLNYSERNKTGNNYFQQYIKDMVFSGMSVKINGSSIKKNNKQPQSPKDVLYDLISCSGVDLTKTSVEARERERQYYLPPDELTLDEMALVDPSLSPIALSARAIEWTLLGKFHFDVHFIIKLMKTTLKFL